MPIKVKDHDKCKVWEQKRRERLNDAFKNLAQLLPHYDPARIPAKIDILEKSTEFVKELRLSNSRLLSNQAETDEKCKLIKELQDEVNKLILRVKQLTILLKKANITIPIGPDIKSLGAKRLKWSGKLRAEDVENSLISGGKGDPVQLTETVSTEKAKVTSVSSSECPSLLTAGTVSSSSLGVITSSSVTSASVASIIIPLKETSNCVKSISSSLTKTSTVTVNTSPTCSTTPLITTVVTSPPVSTVQTSPIKLANPCQPIFTTAAPLQLPLQTFIITPCQPIAGSTPGASHATALNGQNPQIITRVTNILPAPILPKGLDTLGLAKVPIKSLLKPIPKVIRRRRRRKKNVAEDSVPPTQVPADTSSVPPPQPVPAASKQNASESDVEAPVAEPSQTETSRQNETESCKESTTEELTTTKEDKRENDVVLPEVPSKRSEPPEDVPMEVDAAIPVENVCDKEDANEKDKETLNSEEVVSTIPTLTLGDTNQGPAAPVEKQPNAEPCPEDIPVLRIIEAGQKDDNVDQDKSSSILSTIVIQDEENKTGKDSENVIASDLPSVQKETIQDTVSLSVNEVEEVVATEDVSERVQDTDKDAETLSDQQQVALSTGHEQQQTEGVLISDLTSGQKSSTQEEISLNTATNCARLAPTSLAIQDLVSSTSRTNDLEKLPESPTLAPLQEVQESGAVLPVSEVPPVLMSLDKKQDDAPHDTSKNEKEFERIRDALPITTSENTTTTTDKISECIARSIDLIDAHDSELMELGDHWEDTGGSPKSISPTQIFLNMFPLLPRESSTSEPPQQPSTSSSSTAVKASSTTQSFLPVSTSSRSSFFIDAMLPEDHSSSAIENPDPTLSLPASHSPYLPMTPPQYQSSQQISSPFSLSNNYYWTAPLASSSNNTGFSMSDPLSFDFRPIITTSTQTSQTETTSANSIKSSTNPTTTIYTPLVPSSVSLSTSSSSSSLATTKVVSSGSTSSPRSAKRSKTSSTIANAYSGPAKLNLSFDNKLTPIPISSSSVKSSVATTGQSASVTTTSITWTVATPSQSTVPLQQSFPSIPQTTGIHLSSTTSTSVVSSSSQLAHQHSCSLFDSLNPMDAAFFRPLMNALDAHDFRGLEFPPTSALPPPLIPPPPTKPLFSTFTKTPSSSSTLHDANMGQFLHHPTPPIFGSDSLPSLAPTQSSSSKAHQSRQACKTMPVDHSLSPVKSQSRIAETVSKSSTLEKQVTSRTSGRQKPETKKTKPGKSSRTQPYTVPNVTPTPTITEPKKQQNYSFHTIQSQIATSKNPPSSTATVISTVVYPSRNPEIYQDKIASTSSNLQFQVSQVSPKTKPQAPVKQNKPSRNTVPVNTSKQNPAVQSTLQFQPKAVSSVATSTIATMKTSVNVPAKPPQSVPPRNSGSYTQNFQPSSEPAFQLFPEFTQTANTIGHFSGVAHTQDPHSTHHQSHVQSSQDQSLQGNFHLHRSHPYYFSEVPAPTYENVNVGIHHQSGQGHSQPQSSETNTQKFAYHQNANPYPHQHRNEGHNQQQRHVQHQSQTVQQSQPNFSHTPGMQQRSAVQQVPTQTNHPVAQVNQRHYANQQSSSLVSQPLSAHSQANTVPNQPTLAVSTGKVKHQPQTSTRSTQPLPFHTTTQQSMQQGSAPLHPHHTHLQPVQSHQHQLPQGNIALHSQHTHAAASRTVNWMTDTGYRSSGPSTSAKQQTSSSVSANNPFSVSKLVGTSSSSTSKQHVVQPHQGGTSQSPRHGSRNVPQQQPQQVLEIQQPQSRATGHHTSTSAQIPTKTNKTSRNPATSVAPTKTTASRQPSQTHSNYCAEALIRKNPQQHSSSDWGTHFGMGGTASSSHQTSSGSNYQHHHQPPVQAQHHQPNPSENLSYGSYSYPSSSGHSNVPHFSQPQYHTSQPQPHHGQTSNQSTNYNPPTPSQQQSQHGHLQHYPNQQHHSHQQYHHIPHGSTSSVSNFNLSTIFPEINDKRNSGNNNNSGGVSGSQGRPMDGNAGNTGCNFHPNFGSQPHNSSGH